jgi:hypothetical protein
MSDLKNSLQHLAERGSSLGSDRLRERVAMELAGSATHQTTGMIPGWAIAAAAATVVFVVIGATTMLLGGSDSPVASLPPAQSTASTPAITTVTEAPVLTTVAEVPVPVEGWNPILSETVAGVPPPATTCPPGATPDLPGPVDQVRPDEGPWTNQAAVFDTHAGRIVYLDETGETWTFDVCTNTWHQMNPTWVLYGGDPKLFSVRGGGELVYDIDSDRTIAFGPGFVSVYDATANTWTRQSPEPNDLDLGWLPGAVYDPISGLVLVVAGDGALFGYDVETDVWTRIGIVIAPREVTSEGQTQTVGPPFLVGYVTEADRLAFLRFGGAPFQDEVGLMNPRTGETTPLEQPPGGVMGGFGSFRYATGGETAYTYGDRGVCRLDPATLDWKCSAGSQREAMPSAMVYDPINTRIVVINDFCCTWPGTTLSDEVWAIDFDTGKKVELLTTANTRTETDGS